MLHTLSTTQPRIWFCVGDVRSGRVSPLQVRFFGDPVDMLYSELIIEHFNVAANVPSFGSSFVPQSHTNLPEFQFLLITSCTWSPSLKPFGYKA